MWARYKISRASARHLRARAMAKPTIRIHPDSHAAAAAAADDFVARAVAAVRSHGSFTVALAGGSTPKTLYGILADRTQNGTPPRIPWDKVHLFFGDERHVPPDHQDSNYRMANEAMIS